MTFKEDYRKRTDLQKRTYKDGVRIFRIRDFGTSRPNTKDSVFVDSYIVSGERKGTYERRRMLVDECRDSVLATQEEIELLNRQIIKYSRNTISPDFIKKLEEMARNSEEDEEELRDNSFPMED